MEEVYEHGMTCEERSLLVALARQWVSNKVRFSYLVA